MSDPLNCGQLDGEEYTVRNSSTKAHLCRREYKIIDLLVVPLSPGR